MHKLESRKPFISQAALREREKEVKSDYLVYLSTLVRLAAGCHKVGTVRTQGLTPVLFIQIESYKTAEEQYLSGYRAHQK